MTAGRTHLDPNASIYDTVSAVLFDTFPWDKRADVLKAAKRILGAQTEWTLGGAYLFWAPPLGGKRGEVLYCGESTNLVQRLANHLLGPGKSGGNKYVELSVMFGGEEARDCGLALLIVTPDKLPHDITPDNELVIEDSAAKHLVEGLEALLLRASINWQGMLPRLNDREDQARSHHDFDTSRYVSLVRFLMDDHDATRDFPSFSIRAEESQAKKWVEERLLAFRNTR